MFASAEVEAVQTFDHTLLETPIESQMLERAFLFPDASIAFNSVDWKKFPKHRFSMLFNLYRMSLHGKSPEEMHELLGEPERTSFDTNCRSDFYAMDLMQDKHVSLTVFYRAGKLEALSFEQRSDNGFRRVEYEPEWQMKDLDWSSSAEDFNRKYFLVGAPVNCLGALVGMPIDDHSGIYRSNHFEMRFSEDGKTVSSFRIGYPGVLQGDDSKYTAWQTRDFRPDPRCFNTANSLEHLHLDNDYLFRPGTGFSHEAWMADHALRHGMLYDLVRSYQFIGKTRAEITTLLGTAGSSITNSTPQSPAIRYGENSSHVASKTGQSFETCDRYQLWDAMCGNAAVGYFEIAYVHDSVTGFRIKIDPSGDSGLVFSTISGPLFGYWGEP